jgi:hypothetical protein
VSRGGAPHNPSREIAANDVGARRDFVHHVGIASSITARNPMRRFLLRQLGNARGASSVSGTPSIQNF